MLAFFAFIVAMFISMLLIPPLMRSASRYAFVDLPGERKVHKAPIPRIGGLAMVAGSVMPVLLWVDQSDTVFSFLWGVGVILAFGLWDDRKELGYKAKFCGQLVAVTLVVFYGDVLIRFVPFCGLEPIPYGISVALTIFALLGITNAINLSDGLDGLAGGTTLLSIGALSLLAFLAKDPQLLIMSMAVMGAIVGFLRFNTYPAQVFMGDSGSQFLGFSAGVLVIVLTQQSSPILSPAMPLLLLGLPLIDTFLVMAQRLLDRRSPFKPDQNHIHHKLLKLGLDHYESVVAIYVLQATLVSMAFVFRFYSDTFLITTFAAVLGFLATLFWLTESNDWKVRRSEKTRQPSAITKLARRLKQQAILSRGPTLFVAMSMPLAGLIAVSRLDSVPADASLTTYSLLAVAIATFFWRRRRSEFSVFERLILYVTITMLVYYWCVGRDTGLTAYPVENIYFLVLGAGVVMAYRFGENENFSVTPTDVLIILIAILVPTLTRTLLPQQYIGEVAIKTLVLFYALELVLSAWRGKLGWVRVGALSVLAVFAIRLLWIGIPVSA